MSRSRDLFERIQEHGEGAIDAMIADRQSEELFLDFKRSADDGAGAKLHQNDRLNLNKAVSGFANSEGGVIVWGVDCSRDPTLGDVARAKVPIHNPQRFLSWLEGAISGCTVPPHPGVMHHAVVKEGASTGFVATHVPKSYLAPHQCTKPVQYYMRVGSEFAPAPHGILSGLFGRPGQGALFHMWSFTPPEFKPIVGDLRAVQLRSQLLLSTVGPGLVRDIFVNCVVFGLEGRSAASLSTPTPSDWDSRLVFGSRLNLVSRDTLRLAPEGIISPLTLTLDLQKPFLGDLVYEVVYGHHSSPTTKLTFRASKDQLDYLFSILAVNRNGLNRQQIAELAFGVREPAVHPQQ